MTLVVTITGAESIWLVADRRLSSSGRKLSDDARKIMTLDTTDGVALLGYAGLGMTALGTEPGVWMSAVLRGRNVPLEKSLEILAGAMKEQLPKHLVQLRAAGAPVHNVIVSAFVGLERRLYSIDMAVAPDNRSFSFSAVRWNQTHPRSTEARIAVAGSGAAYLNLDRRSIRCLLRIVKANDCGDISDLALADHLAHLNNEVALRSIDNSVGPRCIVAWRHKREGRRGGGGGHQFYTGTARDASSHSLPTISNGLDVTARADLILSHSLELFQAIELGGAAMTEVSAAIHEAEIRLPRDPDEKLR